MPPGQDPVRPGAAPPAGGLSVETLGPLRAYAAGRELSLGPPKQRVVFAVLALNAGNVVVRDDLVDRLWGDSPPATAAGNVHTYVSGLRRTLAGLGVPLASNGSGYTLQLDPDLVDIRVVERLAARARTSRDRADPAGAVAAFDQALARWRPGSALGGLPGPFAAEHRALVADLRLRLILERAEILLGLQQPTTVADQLRAQVPANPYHERLRALLMTALHRSGRTADALAQYQELRRLLAEDLGIHPSAETRALHCSILAEGAATRSAPAGSAPAGTNPAGTTLAATAPPPPAAEPVRPAQLPLGVGGFVGRADSVRHVLDAGREPREDDGTGRAPTARIALIVGAGGIGKTALAVRCAHLLACDYPDGQLYVNLRGFDPRHPARPPADALRHLLASLSASSIPADHEERVALWRSLVHDKRVLIVLDNAESADQVEDLLPGGGASFVIVTSRNRLSGLAVRYAAPRVALPPLTAEESLELLAASIGRTRVTAELPAVRRLAELCEHLPLALRIAAEQVCAGTPTHIAELTADLEDVRHRLDTLQIAGDEVSSVRGVLSWSYDRLNPATARAFRALGMLPGSGIRVETTAALLDVSRPEADAALRGLVAHHLLETAAEGYRMHDLTRLYAEEAARAAESVASRREALRRLLQWYVRTLTQGPDEPSRFRDADERVAWCAREWDTIAPLLRTAQRIGCHQEAAQLAGLLFGYFTAAGSARDWVAALRIGLRSAELLDDRAARAALLDQLRVATSRLESSEAG